MQHDLFSSLDSFQAISVAASSFLLVRDVAGGYRAAEADEVLLAAQRLLAAQVRGSDVMSSPAVVKDFLRTRLGTLPHEVFAVVSGCAKPGTGLRGDVPGHGQSDIGVSARGGA